ncbi:MAG: OmpA family protein [Ignavibacteria bacterium]|nr:OmpA family protein [Ignavibacteria bacterium]
MRKSLVVVVVMCSIGLSSVGFAQSTYGRWSLGAQGGLNLWFNDLNERTIGPGGTISLRYGLSRVFSLGVVGGYEELKSEQTGITLGLPYNYLKLHAIPVSVVGWFHLLPGKSFSPFVYVGAGAMFYQRQDGLKNFIPDDKFRTTFLIPGGVGFEAFASKKVSVTVDLGFRVTDDNTDNREFESLDTYATFKAGVNIYLGSSDADDDDNDGLTNGEERRLGTNPELADTEGDGLKDGEEIKRYKTNPLSIDTDGDGLADGDEVFKYKTDPARTDTDEDGLGDGEELQKYRTDPLKLDTDGDSLMDGDEILKYGSDPLKVDSDGDGLSDWDEVKTYKTDPRKGDTDGDGLTDSEEVKKHKTDPLKLDTDGGGMNDGAEVSRKSNPLNPKDDVVKETIILEKGKTVILEGVNFATGSATLTRTSRKTLEKVFIAFVTNPSVEVEIAGYTDNVGSVELNNRLSLRRAQAVKSWLANRGIEARRMTTVGRGMRDPIARNDTPEGRAQNRRIEFHVRK